MLLSRRSFVGVSLSALLLGAPHLAEARFPRGGSASSGFNGGRSQTNTNFLANSEFPFLNQFKEAASWTLNNANAPPLPDMFDSLGWPNTAAAFSFGSVDWSIIIPTQAERPGSWCITWDGTGSILAGGGGSQLTSKTFTGSIAGDVLTIPGSITGGAFQYGERVQTNSGNLVLPNTIVMAQLTSTTYRVSKSQTVTSAAMTADGGSTSSSSGVDSGFFSCTIASGVAALVFRIMSMGSSSDYINNVKIFHADDAALLQAGNVFGQKFKQRLIEANFGAIRFLNWQSKNTNNITTWDTRKPINYAFYAGYQLRSDLYAGITSMAANAYSTAAVPAIHSSDGTAWVNGDAPKQGDTIHVLINASAVQSGTCSLRIGTGGSTSAINMLNAYSGPLSIGSDSYPEGGTFKSLATLVYDATLAAWIKQGGAAEGSAGIDNAAPPELMLQLCKEVGAHPWFIAPYLSIDPATDYMPRLVDYTKTYIQANAPWMIPRFEGPNELWNNGAGFYQTGYAVAKSAIEWSGGNYHDWYGKAQATLGQICAAILGGGLGTSYHLVCGVQTGSLPTSASNERMAASKYIAQAAPAQSPLSGAWGTITFTKTAANLVTSHVACANYNAPSDRYKIDDLQKGFSYSATNRGNPSAQAVVAAAYVDTLTGAADGNFNLAQLAIYYGAWKSWAAGYSVNKMCGYEGCWSPDLLNGVAGFPTNTSWWSTITGATKDATGCVLTLAATCNNAELELITGNPGVAGMVIVIPPTGAVSGMTQLNNPFAEPVTFAGGGSANINGSNTLILNQAVYFYGTLPNELTYDTKIQNGPGAVDQSIPYYVVSAGNPFQISATRGGSPITFNSVGSSVTAQEAWFILSVPDSTHIKLDVNSSAFSTYTSGGLAVYSNSQNYSNNIRTAGKYSPNLQGYTYGNISPASNYKLFVDAGGEFPSNYLVGGPVPSRSVWPVLENVYAAATPPQWAAYIAFNH